MVPRDVEVRYIKIKTLRSKLRHHKGNPHLMGLNLLIQKGKICLCGITSTLDIFHELFSFVISCHMCTQDKSSKPTALDCKLPVLHQQRSVCACVFWNGRGTVIAAACISTTAWASSVGSEWGWWRICRITRGGGDRNVPSANITRKDKDFPLYISILKTKPKPKTSKQTKT